jgi:hypothetical protein
LFRLIFITAFFFGIRIKENLYILKEKKLLVYILFYIIKQSEEINNITHKNISIVNNRLKIR